MQRNPYSPGGAPRSGKVASRNRESPIQGTSHGWFRRLSELAADALCATATPTFRIERADTEVSFPVGCCRCWIAPFHGSFPDLF